MPWTLYGTVPRLSSNAFFYGRFYFRSFRRPMFCSHSQRYCDTLVKVQTCYVTRSDHAIQIQETFNELNKDDRRSFSTRSSIKVIVLISYAEKNNFDKKTNGVRTIHKVNVESVLILLNTRTVFNNFQYEMQRSYLQ